jgi:hypothetical protein
VQERIKNLDTQRLELKKQGEQLDQLRANLALAPATGTKTTGDARPATAG